MGPSARYRPQLDTISAVNTVLPRWVIVTFVGLFFAAVAAIGAWSIHLPYIAFSPGPVGDAIDVVIADPDLQIYEPDGELFFLTVSISPGGVNLFEAIEAGADPTVDLVRRQAVRRDDESDEEYKQRNLDAMDQSIDTAVAVALDRSGVPVTIESDGVLVVDLTEGSGAAGVLQPDDVIVAVNGEAVQLSGDIGVVIGDLEPGDVVTIDIVREGEPMIVEVELTASEDGSRTLIGILAQTANPRYPISIEAANVGGPSAGMMYTLAIMDLLVEGDLAKGHLVAGTGTIRADGTVGNIGGVRQKVVAAEAAGAELMLVPAGNYEQALTAPRKSMALVSVATIDEALAALEALDSA